MTLTVIGFLKHSELDRWEGGCDPSTAQAGYFDLRVTGKSVPELSQNIARALCCDNEDLTLDACDEPGRIDVEVTETAEGSRATASELVRWKRGELDLWTTTYTCHVHITRPAGRLMEAARS